ncbi:MAG: dihydroxyacetone kinase subunit DhaL [Synergistaceae bacterium]
MDKLSIEQFKKMLFLAASAIEDAKGELTELDSQIGDGDHGTTMAKVMHKVSETAEACGECDFKKLLSDIGMSVLNMGGGATVPLFGSLFSGMSRAVPDGADSLSKDELAAAFKGGEAKLLKLSKAPLGAKTLVDALTPAVEAFSSFEGDDIAEALESARLAAHEGCMKTKDYVAHFGRAKNLGERALGIPDPGSVSVSIIFKAFARSAREVN